eukprot:CAMPEP_0185734888 /NCGR_PEP_ID=MMETSP1171-20130828/23742_1 /TAXON_ID=374046 /ORGANISM="Helicotheca tamensis, Strain CCMP826" /LENGTH=270 /DNA_ID=CAMNT_0028405015 /DNA_START=62 /DNA_END=874 /DNA_ORIENTATION=+
MAISKATPHGTTKRDTQPSANRDALSAGPKLRDGQRNSACGFYMWDVISAVKYHWCMRLLRDNLYEGKGGKMFVRIRPGSILEALYPCSRHSPDRCIFCGMTFQDHLTKWWEPKLSSPYDDHLDMICTKGTSVQDNDKVAKTGLWKKRSNAVLNKKVKNTVKVYTFHEAYVEGVEFETSGKDNKLQVGSRASEKPIESQILSSRVISSRDGYDIRKSVDGITYRVHAQSQRKLTKGLSRAICFVFREILLMDIEQLLWLEREENRSNYLN